MNKTIHPIFVMGAPRSGTTMLSSILSAREDALALPEMHYIHELLKDEMIYGSINTKDVFNSLYKNFMFEDLKIVSNNAELREIVGETVRETINNILYKYNDKYKKKKFSFWIEHTPHNYNYYDVLKYHYENAKFIHIFRDGRAVYRSTKETDWGYKDVITGSDNWRTIVEKCIILSKKNATEILQVKYEDLTNFPEKTINNICTFLNMDYQKNMLKANGILKPSYAIYAKSLGSKIHVKSQNLWQNSLKKYEIEYFSMHNKRLLNYLGYNIDAIDGGELKNFNKIYHKAMGRLKKYYFGRKAKKRFNNIFSKK